MGAVLQSPSRLTLINLISHVLVVSIYRFFITFVTEKSECLKLYHGVWAQKLDLVNGVSHIKRISCYFSLFGSVISGYISH